jgi:hypothetical protein
MFCRPVRILKACPEFLHARCNATPGADAALDALRAANEGRDEATRLASAV